MNNKKIISKGRQVGDSTRILLHSPDITLKGKNQEDFQNALSRNIKQILRSLDLKWQVKTAKGRVCVNTSTCAQADIDRAMMKLRATSGVSSLAATRWLKPNEIKAEDGLNWKLIEDTMVELASSAYRKHASFSIQFNRVDKRLPFTSQEVEVRLGNVVRANTGWDKVKLNNPDCTFYIDAYPDGLYFYVDKIIGPGGLPLGTGGRVLGLLSGGIDSPVASFMLARRGCSVDFFHLTASHVDEEAFQDSVVARLAKQLSYTTLHSRLFVAPYTWFDLKLQGKPSGYELVLFRRFMLRSAERLAKQIDAGALVVGDSLGQVASQTLENIVSASAPINVPIFRPLIGMNKQEIIKIARNIETYKTSIEPYKDCCALIAQNPKTRSFDAALEKLEERLIPDYEEVIDKTFEDMVCFEYKCGIEHKKAAK